MKTPQFTPGPWQWKEWGDSFALCGHNGLRIDGPIHFRAYQLNTNARLIAQAPAMYEALAAMVRQFEPFDPGADDGVSDCEALVNARSILNTINGKE